MKDQLSNYEAYIVLFSPRSITGVWLESKQSTGTIRLVSMHHKKLQHLELERLTIFNPTAIGTLIKTWYKNCHQAMPLLFALHGPAIEEHVVALHTAHPTPSQFPISHAPHWHWKHTYLYSLDHRHCFYVCGIKKSILFQYQLMAIEQHLPLSLLTTERMALTHCYRSIFGAAYRPAHLAQSMSMHNNRIEQVFFKEDLSRILKLPADMQLNDSLRLPLLTACGLFVMQGDIHETY